MEPDEYDLDDLREDNIRNVARESVRERFEKLEEKLEEFESSRDDGILPEKETAEFLLKDIQKYHSELFENKIDEKNHRILSIKTKTDEYIKEKTETFEHLEGVIRSLLPGAGAIKFASTYFEAKKRYGVLSAHEMIGGVLKNKKHWITTGFKTLIFYFLFIAPLGAIVWLFSDIVLKPNSYKNLGDLLYITLLLRFALVVPFGAVSWFGLYSIRLNRQLYEKYNHKQRVMELYYIFNSEIKEQGTDKQAQQLLDIMMETISADPSLELYKDRAKNKKQDQPKTTNN